MGLAKAGGTSARDAGPDGTAAPASTHYAAFISYSHAADSSLAPALRNALQRFATPWLVFRWRNPTRLLRIFQDQASLSANPKLWPAIESALLASDWFILFASPAAANSPWVGQEIDFWCRNKPLDRLLIVQTEGDIAWDAATKDFDWPRTTALPQRLRAVFSDEPRWIDARWARTAAQTSLKDPRLRDLVAELAAPLRGIAKDDLIGEDIRQVQRLELWRNLAFGVLSLLLAGAVVAAVLAIQQRRLAEQRLAAAQRNESKALAMRANDELGVGGPAVAVRIALAALPQHAATGDRPYVAEAEAALRNGMRQLRELRHFAAGQALVLAAAQSPDGQLLVTGLQDGMIALWNVATGGLLGTLRAANTPQTSTVLHGGSTVSTRVELGTLVLVAFSADGHSIVTVDASAHAHVWETASRRLLATLSAVDQLHLTFLQVSAAASLDGRFVVLNGASGPDANKAVLWDTVSGKVSMLLHAPDPDDQRRVRRQVVFAAFSADGRSLVTGASDHSIWLWDVATAGPVAQLRGHTGGLVFAGFSADNRSLVTAAQDGTARLWALPSGQAISRLSDGGGSINAAALGPDGQALVTAHEDGTARLWDLRTGAPPKVLRGHQGALRSAAFSHDGRMLITTSADATARLWNAATGEALDVLRGHKAVVAWGDFSPDGRHLLTRGGDAVRLWNTTLPSASVVVPTGHDGELQSIAFSRDGSSLVTASWDHTARLTDLQSPQRSSVFRHPTTVQFAAISPDSQWLLTVAGDGIARLWAAGSVTPVKLLQHPDGAVQFAAFTADGQALVTAGSDKTIRVWALSAAGKVVVHHPADDQIAGSYQQPLAISPDGRQLIVGFSNGSLALWDLALGKTVWRFPAMNISRADFSPDGRRLVTVDASQERIALLWDTRSGKTLAALRHPGPVHSAAFSPDAETVVTVAGDGLIQLWDVASGQALETLGRHADNVAVAFGPDGRRIASAGFDVRLWPLMPRQQALIDLACVRVPWPLSAVERERFMVSDEWCTPSVSTGLQSQLGMNPASALGR